MHTHAHCTAQRTFTSAHAPKHAQVQACTRARHASLQPQRGAHLSEKHVALMAAGDGAPVPEVGGLVVGDPGNECDKQNANEDGGPDALQAGRQAGMEMHVAG